MFKNTLISIRMMIVMIILLGLIYPLFMTGISLIFFNKKANGSIINENNKIIGSALIGQKFTYDKYFWPRASASDYGTLPSGASNLGYTSADLVKNIQDREKLFGASSVKDVPKDLLFASGSGVDPHITPDAARFQIDRVAKARNFNDAQKKELSALVEKSVEKRQFLILGEERVNVLLLNIALDKMEK
jgi:potassium-transporting ATPase KdpC subunit